jgi:hypothetical protein
MYSCRHDLRVRCLQKYADVKAMVSCCLTAVSRMSVLTEPFHDAGPVRLRSTTWRRQLRRNDLKRASARKPASPARKIACVAGIVGAATPAANPAPSLGTRKRWSASSTAALALRKLPCTGELQINNPWRL